MHDVFISYSSKDQKIADAIVNILETRMARYEKLVRLDCLEDNTAAIALYKKCNFRIGKKFDGYKTKNIKCLELVYEKNALRNECLREG